MPSRKKHFLIGGLIVICLLAALLLRPESSEHAEERKNERFDSDYIAVIRVEGSIIGQQQLPGIFADTAAASSDRLMREFRRAADDPHAKAVLLRINSPGGSATATQEVGVEMARFRGTGKPIVVSMGDSCASGGYWLAAGGDHIFANPSTLTGSIGVYIGYTNYRELLDKIGIYNDKIKSGAHKDILSPDRPMTDEERALVQSMVNDIYEQFVDVVADGRHMDRAQVKALADGRIFTGRQALDAGLVDELGNYYEALTYTAELVHLPTDRPPVREYADGIAWQRFFKSAFGSVLDAALNRALTAAGMPTARLETEVPHVR